MDTVRLAQARAPQGLAIGLGQEMRVHIDPAGAGALGAFGGWAGGMTRAAPVFDTIVDELNRDERNGLGRPRVFQDGRPIIV